MLLGPSLARARHELLTDLPIRTGEAGPELVKCITGLAVRYNTRVASISPKARMTLSSATFALVYFSATGRHRVP